MPEHSENKDRKIENLQISDVSRAKNIEKLDGIIASAQAGFKVILFNAVFYIAFLETQNGFFLIIFALLTFMYSLRFYFELQKYIEMPVLIKKSLSEYFVETLLEPLLKLFLWVLSCIFIMYVTHSVLDAVKNHSVKF